MGAMLGRFQIDCATHFSAHVGHSCLFTHLPIRQPLDLARDKITTSTAHSVNICQSRQAGTTRGRGMSALLTTAQQHNSTAQPNQQQPSSLTPRHTTHLSIYNGSIKFAFKKMVHLNKIHYTKLGKKNQIQITSQFLQNLQQTTA